MTKIAAAILALTPLAVSQPYVGDQQFRFAANDKRCLDDHSCSFEEHRTADHHDYSMNFIEVRDSGDLFDPDQLTQALAQIEKARFDGKQKPIVFIYVHGWHNNAKEIKQASDANCTDKLYNGDVAKFRNCGVAEIAKAYGPTVDSAPPRVVGIYMAWHGNDFNLPVLNIVPSYPIRRHFARKVGERDMAKAFQQIVDQIAQNGHRNDYFVIAMGHSFGSRVLENAAERIIPEHPDAGFMQRYRQKITNAAAPLSSSEQRPPVDLIFHVNAASSHFVSRTTIRDWEQACGTGNAPAGCDRNPLYLAVSSRADLVTSIVMPIANIVFFGPLTDRYHIISAANTPWMQTNKIPQSVPSCASNPAPGSFCFKVPGTSEPVIYQVEPKRGELHAVFWSMNTDHWIAAPEAILHGLPIFRKMVAHHWLISSHGDVWNPGVFSLVRSVIERESAKAPLPETATAGSQLK